MRYPALLVLIGMFVAPACADIPPPPPPKGKKYVSLENSVAVDQGVTGYVFVLAESQFFPDRKSSFTRLNLGDKPQKVPAAGRRSSVGVIAIPGQEAKKFANDGDLIAALGKGAFENAASYYFDSTAFIAASDKRDSVPCLVTITKIDPKKGIIVSRTSDAQAIGDDKPQSQAPDGPRGAFAALFAVVGIVSFGLWCTRRGRKVQFQRS